MKKIVRIFLAMMILAIFAGCPGGTARAEEPEILFGTLNYASAISNRSTGDSFYYSDEWLSGSPEERNDRLALISFQLDASSGGSEAASLLKKLGFSDAKSRRYDSGDSRDCVYFFTENDGRTYWELTCEFTFRPGP